MHAAPGKVLVDTSLSFLERHQFLIYRLFSLCGLVPIGGYMVVHLLVNATVVDSPATFQKQVDSIHSLGMILPLVEWVFIFIPIMFHAVIGLVIISGGMPNTGSYPYVGNVRYTLQRFTGMVAFAFITWHVIHMHHFFGGPFKGIGGAQFDPEHATSSAASAIQAALWVKVLYAIGVLSCVFHFANGLSTQGITWGLWASPAARRRANYVCGALGVVLACVGLSALTGLSKQDIKQAQDFEAQHQKVKKMLEGETPLEAVLSESKQGSSQ